MPSLLAVRSNLSALQGKAPHILAPAELTAFTEGRRRLDLHAAQGAHFAIAHVGRLRRGGEGHAGSRGGREDSFSNYRCPPAVLGPRQEKHRTRIMVTMPSEAATDPLVTETLLRQGMDIMCGGAVLWTVPAALGWHACGERSARRARLTRSASTLAVSRFAGA